jgi:hypothetical protein
MTDHLLPAAAAGEEPLLPLAWERSAGNGWRLVLLRLPMLVPWKHFVIGPMSKGRHLSATELLPLLFLFFLNFALGAATVAAAFRALVDPPPAAHRDQAAPDS